MKKIVLLFSWLVASIQISSAQKEAWNWNFGINAGLKFDSTLTPTAITTSAMTNFEGVASISDRDGKLLFYTNGTNVYNALNEQMPNGFGLLGHASSTQSSIIVRKPLSDSLYYIFTVDYLSGSNGLQYSIVDMTLDGGKGDLSSKNNVLLANSREKVTAIRHANGIDFWILVIDWQTDDLYAYLVNHTGVSAIPVVSPMDMLQMGITNPGINRSNGYMKANLQGNRIAMGLWAAYSFDLFDFDNATGIVSNHIKIQGNATTMGPTYGVEFSPDGSKLYGTTMSAPFKLIQFDLNSNNGDTLFAKRTILKSEPNSLCNNYYYGALQLGPNGKIYSTTECDTFLNVISQPDSLGQACNFQPRSIPLAGRECKLGLPNFIADMSILTPTKIILQSAEQFLPLLYPNPTNGNLTLSFNSKSEERVTFILTDVFGRERQKQEEVFDGQRLKIDLPNGIYYATLSNGKTSNTSRIVFQK